MSIKDKKILLIRLSALGDVIFNIPLANLLKKNGAELTWLVSEKGFDIVNNNPCCDRVILAPVEKWKKEKNKFKNFIEYLKIIKFIRKEKFDIVLDTQLILKSFIWTIFSGGKRRIVAKNAREGAIFGGNEVIEAMFRDFSTHAVENYYKFAKHLNLDTKEVKVTLPPSSSETIKKVDELLKKTDKKKPLLTICPATTWFNKHWKKENWREFLSKIDKNEFNIIFIGLKSDKELIDYINTPDGLDLSGKTNLLDLIEIFKRSDVVISLDSGSTHLAWASSKPKILSIFCSTPKQRYAPLGSNHIALSGNLPCQPCHRKKCPKKTNECINYPTVDEVLDAFKKISASLQS